MLWWCSHGDYLVYRTSVHHTCMAEQLIWTWFCPREFVKFAEARYQWLRTAFCRGEVLTQRVSMVEAFVR